MLPCNEDGDAGRGREVFYYAVVNGFAQAWRLDEGRWELDL